MRIFGILALVLVAALFCVGPVDARCHHAQRVVKQQIIVKKEIIVQQAFIAAPVQSFTLVPFVAAPAYYAPPAQQLQAPASTPANVNNITIGK